MCLNEHLSWLQLAWPTRVSAAAFHMSMHTGKRHRQCVRAHPCQCQCTNVSTAHQPWHAFDNHTLCMCVPPRMNLHLSIPATVRATDLPFMLCACAHARDAHACVCACLEAGHTDLCMQAHTGVSVTLSALEDPHAWAQTELLNTHMQHACVCTAFCAGFVQTLPNTFGVCVQPELGGRGTAACAECNTQNTSEQTHTCRRRASLCLCAV